MALAVSLVLCYGLSPLQYNGPPTSSADRKLPRQWCEGTVPEARSTIRSQDPSEKGALLFRPPNYHLNSSFCSEKGAFDCAWGREEESESHCVSGIV
ncbi:hypothetical protein CEXT_588971 [Caerostris extrusa]|uniref:Uncharacterized protein n=1 Tax=Caerostris extrusa TaxID=172846 RepID=A0AAV4TR99_CAEEX|nr:hypothetical protein CEXT_588971 [Caerostris extrusa]